MKPEITKIMALVAAANAVELIGVYSDEDAALDAALDALSPELRNEAFDLIDAQELGITLKEFYALPCGIDEQAHEFSSLGGQS